MKAYDYKPVGVCPVNIHFELDDEGRLHNISYTGGCNGNLKAVSILAEGMSASDYIGKLEGNTCGFKQTSCTDQLVKALRELGY